MQNKDVIRPLAGRRFQFNASPTCIAMVLEIKMFLFTADIDAKQSPDEVTSLHLACRYNSDAVIQLLLIRGAAVNATDAKGRTPLHYATRRGHQLAIKVYNDLFFWSR